MASYTSKVVIDGSHPDTGALVVAVRTVTCKKRGSDAAMNAAIKWFKHYFPEYYCINVDILTVYTAKNYGVDFGTPTGNQVFWR